jgi:hypothetical protein
MATDMGDLMTDTNYLLDAVDVLTKVRKVHTTMYDDAGDWHGVHTEDHPPLLQMLIDGTGITRGGKSSDPGIPIDADALELWGQVRDLTRLWCKQLTVPFTDDLLGSLRRWFVAHNNAHRGGRISDVINTDITRMVQGWVRMIEAKFDPIEKREWRESCPNWVQRLNPDGGELGFYRCDAKRVLVDGVYRFAIGLNITAWTAECVACKHVWNSRTALSDLRYESNVWELEKAQLANGDTPGELVSPIAM